jgi:Fe-S cluster assembly protein SufD
MSIIKAETAPYLDAFRARAVAAGEPASLTAKRHAALARFGEIGFPTRRMEAWRFTNLRSLERAPFLPASNEGAVAPVAVEPERFAVPTHRLVLVNGRFAPALSDIGALPEGVWLASTADTLAQRPELLNDAVEPSDTDGAQPFASLNAAFFADGFVLSLAPGVTLERPVEIVHLAQGTAQSFHLRNAILLGAGAKANLLESFGGSGSYWTNAVSIVHLAASASLTHVKIQDEGAEAVHFALTRALLADATSFESFVLTLGAALSRHDSLARLSGAAVHCTLNGAYLLRGTQEATNATFVEHIGVGGTTRELFKGVVEDRGHGVFLGSIAVRPDAQRTDATQLNRNLLLSRRATVDTKPELEILADDVKCSHGATVGDLDETSFFYLLSRGIEPDVARRMLVEAFVAEVIDEIEDPAMHDHLRRHLTRWLAAQDTVSAP